VRRFPFQPVFRLFLLTSFFCLWSTPSSGLAASGPKALPLLIARQSASVQSLWRETESLIDENSRLQRPLPDPYFARGDLWAASGGHEDALTDYMTGTRLLMATRPGLVDQSRALERLAIGLDRLHRSPRPKFPLEAERAFQTAMGHYYGGRHAAAIEFFAEASRLRPDEAGYRAFRGLNLRKVGRPDEAEREIAVVRSLLREGDDKPLLKSRFYQRLTRVQGPDRWWLEARLMAVEFPPSVADEARRLLGHGRASPGNSTD
jgi:hypothetical protein